MYEEYSLFYRKSLEYFIALLGYWARLFEIQLSVPGISDASDFGTDCHEICLTGKDMLCPAPADIFHDCPGRRQHGWIYLRQIAWL